MSLLQGDQGTGLGSRKIGGSCHQFLDQSFLLTAAQNGDTGQGIALAEPFQDRSDLRLEDDDDGQKAPGDDVVH